MRRVLLIVVMGTWVGACARSHAAPTPPPTPTCQTNNTATVHFDNRSTSNTTYDVIWDGSRRTSVGAGSSTQTYTEAAGTHTLTFKLTNTTLLACTTSPPVLAQCSSGVYWCTF